MLKIQKENKYRKKERHSENTKFLKYTFFENHNY